MILKLKQTPGIYLAGFMGSGKTTIGRRLAERLGWSFVDLDDDIEAAGKASISDIFEQRGEAAFRAMEAEAIASRVCEIECGRPMVVALGGGTFAQAANRDLLSAHGITIWLDCPFELIRRRVDQAAHRPLARDPQTFEALFHARRDSYSQADYTVSIKGDNADDAVEAILRLPLFQ